MSSRNLSKDSQSGCTYIPRPPYRGYETTFGLLQRSLKLVQTLYSFVLLAPCLVLRFIQIDLFWPELKHPQDFVDPARKPWPSTVILEPQEHRHSHTQRLNLFLDSLFKTFNRPKDMPVRSINAGIHLLLCNVQHIGRTLAFKLNNSKHFAIIESQRQGITAWQR